VKQFYNNGLVLGAATVVLLATQPVSAQPVLAPISKVTDVQLSVVGEALSVNLKTTAADNAQVFITKTGKSFVADITNAKLLLSQGKNFRQDNPAPGIAAVEVNQVDASSIRITVTGINDVPNNQPIARQPDGISLSFTPAANTTSSSAEPTKKPDVLVPNPQVTIDGKPAQSLGANQPYSQAPPFLPRAVAPPVGDIVTSTIDTSASSIDLGTQERVPRLVLRDAPVREVLLLLAHTAGLNLVYSGSEGASAPSQPGATPNATLQTISLDIENEPVQDVFNYVLRLSGLEANRSGRTIFVGAKLPNSTRDIVMRNLRLNQVSVGVALNFLVTLGAESVASRDQVITTVNAVPVGAGVPPTTQTQTSTQTQLTVQRIDFRDSTPLLRGVQALGDERTSSITLIGSPRLIDIAVAQLARLDIRRRQVVVNVKIIDVDLSGELTSNSSFSFGIGDNYFAVNGGSITSNFGGSRPATATEVANSVTSTPVITNPITGTPFFSTTNTVSIPGTTPGTTVVGVNGTSTVTSSSGSGLFYAPISPASSNPLQPGYSNITAATNNIVTQNADGTTSVSQGTNGTATAALPSLYQFPKKLLAQLQAQIQQQNAKILTDPTLIVQEGQTASVDLTQEVVGNITNTTTSTNSTSTQTVTADKETVGLTLSVKIERIDDNGFVSLSVAPTVQALAANASINVGNNNQTIALVSKRSLNSGLIRLRDGQTLILTGIIQDQDKSTVSKIPILGDIPILGALFRKTDRTNDRSEVVVLLTPQIMDDSERSTYGYNYTPSPEVRNMLERRGLKLQK
jgi:type IV pilus assembly protein PilQ